MDPLLQFVSFLVNNNREYGALIIPSVSKPLPAYLFLKGYSNDNPINQNKLVVDTSQTAYIPFVYAIAALRTDPYSECQRKSVPVTTC
jgi:hypothetical protein